MKHAHSIWSKVSTNKSISGISIDNISHTLACSACIIALLGIGQDYLFAVTHQSAFYLSEALLFKIFWLVFVPLVYGCAYVCKRGALAGISKPWLPGKALLIAIPLVTIHIILSSWLITEISQQFMQFPFYFENILIQKMTENTVIAALFYSMSFLLFVYSSPVAIEAPKDLLPPVIIIKEGMRSVRVDVDSIMWISADYPYVALHTAHKKYLYQASLKEMEQRLSSSGFLRIHRSTVVHTKYVTKLTSRLNGDYDVHITNGDTLRLSRTYRDQVRGHLL